MRAREKILKVLIVVTRSESRLATLRCHFQLQTRQTESFTLRLAAHLSNIATRHSPAGTTHFIRKHCSVVAHLSPETAITNNVQRNRAFGVVF